MSTKIYNGYIINKKMNLSDLFEFQDRVRKQIQEKFIEIYLKAFTKELVTLIDNICMAENVDEFIEKHKDICKSIGFSAFSCTFNHIYDEYKKSKKTNLRTFFYDFDFSVTFHYTSTKKFLCLLFTEDREFKKIWDSQPEVQEYHYQDQTDKPDDIPQRMWTQRRNDWDRALGSDVPSMRGLILEAIDFDRTMPIEHVKTVMGLIKPKEERLYKIAQDKVINNLYMEKRKTIDENDSFMFSVYSEVNNEVKNTLKTYETIAQEELKKYKTNLKSYETMIQEEMKKYKLIDITEDNITMSFKDIINVRDGIEPEE